MKKLWAPWRVEYIERGNQKGCIFCNAGNLTYNDYTLYTGKHSVALLNKFPYNNAHLLIAPKRHEANLESLPIEESTDLQRLIAESITILKTVYKPEGFNLGMNLGKAAGAGIADHLHWHVVPRWNGDTNFMPIVSEIRVMPEHLQRTFEKLKPLFEKIDKEIPL